MKTHTERIKYVLTAIITAFSYFVISYYMMYLGIAEENQLISTILNISLIFIILAEEKLSLFIFKKLKPKVKKTGLQKVINTLFYNVSFKTSLYCFYTGLLLCYAIISADPGFPILGDMYYYFRSTYYGILVLIAADKFLDQVFKDVHVVIQTNQSEKSESCEVQSE